MQDWTGAVTSGGSIELQIDWLQTSVGFSLLNQEAQQAGQLLERVFGDQILQIGSWGSADLFLGYARTQYAALLSDDDLEGMTARVSPLSLPVQSDSVDAVLLPHTLELSSEPHAVLREVHRVLRPDGKLIVLGFNPYSWWGIRNLFAPQGYPPGIHRQISRGRLSDWLRLLNLRIDGSTGCYASPHAGRAGKLLNRCHWIASAYQLVATKETMPMTVIRPRLRQRARLVRGLVNPTTRSASMRDKTTGNAV